MELTRSGMLEKLMLAVGGLLVGYAFKEEIEELLERSDELGPIVYSRLLGGEKEDRS